MDLEQYKKQAIDAINEHLTLDTTVALVRDNGIWGVVHPNLDEYKLPVQKLFDMGEEACPTSLLLTMSIVFAQKDGRWRERLAEYFVYSVEEDKPLTVALDKMKDFLIND